MTDTSPIVASGLETVRARVGAEAEIIETDQTIVACDGGGGALGHPRVFYTLNSDGYAECGYCDRVYVNYAQG